MEVGSLFLVAHVMQGDRKLSRGVNHRSRVMYSIVWPAVKADHKVEKRTFNYSSCLRPLVDLIIIIIIVVVIVIICVFSELLCAILSDKK